MPDGVGGIAGDRLRSFVERIERLQEEKRTIADDIKEVYAEAKGTGFDTKIMRRIIKERGMDRDDLDEQETLLQIYRDALGKWSATPLGQASINSQAEARDAGFQDGIASNRAHEHDWPSGRSGHADYELGWNDGHEAAARLADNEEGQCAPAAEAPPAKRGRPRKAHDAGASAR